MEISLIPCSGASLLLANLERRDDAHYRNEISKLTNDLAVMVREITQKNRALKEANEAVERLARTDALTGLANRRMLDEALQREIARAERLGERFSIILADLDHFKSINDGYGHKTGDLVISSVAAVLCGKLRPYDLAVRYGGEEFVVLLPGTSAEQAIVVAERLRKEVAKIALPEYPRQITVSLGAADWQAGEPPEALFARADAALYSAKHHGRNRVEVAYASPMKDRV